MAERILSDTKKLLTTIHIGNNIASLTASSLTMSEQFSGLPVYKDSTDNIVGILHLKDFVFHNTGTGLNIEACMREPFFLMKQSRPGSFLF